MKKFIYRALKFTGFFIVFFLLINSVFLLIVVKTDWDFRKRLESLRFENPDFELLVVGASTSFDGIDTELLSSKGIKSYNLAMGGTTAMTSYIQLTEYLKKYSNKPSFVILGLNEMLVKTFDDETIHPIIEVTMPDYKYSLNDIPILKFKWLAFEMFKKLISSNHREATLSYGQLKFQKTITDNSSYQELYLRIPEFETSQWIGEIAKLCIQNEIELIIIEMPGYRLTQNQSEMGPFMLNFKNGYSANLYNLNSRNFCSIFDPEKDWIGNSHLNEFGAIKFTNKLYTLVDEIRKNHQIR